MMMESFFFKASVMNSDISEMSSFCEVRYVQDKKKAGFKLLNLLKLLTFKQIGNQSEMSD